MQFGMGSDAATGDWDYIWYANYVNPEPQNGAWGTPESTVVSVSLWGTQFYYENDSSVMGGTPERILSGNVSAELMTLFCNSGKYSSQNFWGSDTKPNSVYGNVSEWDNYYSWFSIFFYKGHSWPVYKNSTYNSCGVSGCQFQHYSVYDTIGPQDPGNPNDILNNQNVIFDYLVNQQMKAYSYRFVVLWTCGSAWPTAIGGFSADGHSWGWEASFMGRIDLNPDGYVNPDTTNRCFIGFDNFSIWYRNSTLFQNHTVSDFVVQFFNYTLQGYSINIALNLASQDIYGSTYSQCPLRTGYWMWDPRQSPRTSINCSMVVRGDGDLIIPH